MLLPIHWKITPKTPEIILDAQEGVFRIEGRSLSENPRLFYEPIINWFKEYKKNANEKTEFAVKLEYINSSSTRVFLQILNLLQDIENLHVIWFYDKEDEEMLEKGEEVMDLVDISYTLESF